MDFDCEAYGAGAREAGALCFFAGALNARVCDSPDECRQRMTAERQRVFGLIHEKAAAGDPDMAYLCKRVHQPGPDPRRGRDF
jgi:hypothetical protein